MKNKIYLSTIKELLNDIYLCIFDGKCDVDELMKSVAKAMDFFKTYCCSIEEVQPKESKVTAGKHMMPVSFNDENLKNADELARGSTVNKIITAINLAVVEYQKKNPSKDLLKNCEEYVKALKHVSSLSYNFHRLENLVNIMKETISYDISHASFFNWAATSLIFHILYINITSVIHRYHRMTVLIQSPSKNDSVSELSTLFQSKRKFIDLFLVDVLPKILTFNISLDYNTIKFSNIVISEDIAMPIFNILSLYKNKELEPHHVKTYLINHSHALVHALTNPIVAGASRPSTPLPAIPVSSLPTVPVPPAPKYEPSHMPDDKDYKKIVLMKFFSLIEKCINAYKEQKPPGTSMVVNIFEGTKGLTIKDGQVIIKKP